MLDRLPRSLDGMGLAAAQAAFLGLVSPLPAWETALVAAAGLALAAPVTAPFPLPAFDNSAMDGYALRSGDLAAASAGLPVLLRLRGEAAAGHGFAGRLGPGEAARITTGAPLPAGADAVLPLEEALPAEPDRVAVPAPLPAGRHVRRAGEDLESGALALPAGATLGPAALALLAALGLATVPAVRRPRVAVLTTGDELRLPGEPRGAAGVYNANLFALAAQIAEAGGEPVSLPAAPDRPEAIARALERAVAGADAVVTSAGMCAGRYDYLAAAVERLGRLACGGLRLRPARHVGLGLIGATPLFSLPGNPGAGLIAFELLVRPALRRLGGHAQWRRPTLPATAAERFAGAGDVANVLWARLEPDGPGWRAHLAGRHGAGMLRGAARAHGLVIVPEGMAGYAEGDAVAVHLLSGLLPGP